MDRDKLYVYDKSGDQHTPFIPLENKGREGATFLGHIVRHYDNLPDYLVLVQGDPFAHMYPEITPKNFQSRLNHLVHQRPSHSQFLFCDPLPEHRMTYGGLMMDKYHELLFQGEPSGMLEYAAGNQYLIPRQIIQRRPKIFYQKLLSMSIKGDHYDGNRAHYEKKIFDPTEIIGWSLERIFPTILSDTPTNPKFIS
jgi:hypothetical protein